jgi:uncharacterized membrane protein
MSKDVIGILLGIAFLTLGVLSILYPELFGDYTPRDKTFALLMGAANVLVGLAAILYYGLLKSHPEKSQIEATEAVCS